MMKRITSLNLLNWASTRDCQEHLPLLIRKLIRASPVQVIKMLIPAGDNIILPGYDGSLDTIDGTENIPSGKSVWEIGTAKDYKKKAEEDFNKRNKSVEITEAQNMSFVFVTPYVWTKKK